MEGDSMDLNDEFNILLLTPFIMCQPHWCNLFYSPICFSFISVSVLFDISPSCLYFCAPPTKLDIYRTKGVNQILSYLGRNRQNNWCLPNTLDQDLIS
uniref:Ovule protein n=1 Tax=Heterorhabditis bacteriophora TaxID=37862 RepID=A0A1I7W6T1_HETBA